MNLIKVIMIKPVVKAITGEKIRAPTIVKKPLKLTAVIPAEPITAPVMEPIRA